MLKIMWMLRLRWLSFLLSILFTVLTAAIAYGSQGVVGESTWSSIFVRLCGFFAMASCTAYLVLNKRLAGLGP